MAATILLCLTGASFASENICGTTKEMMNAEFWVNGTKTAHETILAPAEVQALTSKIREAPGTFCTDILDYPDFLSREEFARKIKSYAARPDNKRYVGAAEADGEFWRRVESNANPGAADETTLVRFGAVVNNCLVKTLPCEEPLYSEADDVLFDMNVESAVKIWEPLAVLHESADDKYYFVESPYCAGWIKKENVALTDRKTLKELAAHDFYMVTGSRVTSDVRTSAPDAGRREFFMGTRLPAADEEESIGGVSAIFGHGVLVPERGADGSLRVVTDRLPRGADLLRGCLPYTQANVLRQAFKMLGERYGWGGMYGSRDCSAFTRDIYLTFGIELPRNSLPQAKAPAGNIDVSKLTAAEKAKLLAGAPAGTLVQMPGHIMLYLGTIRGRPYIRLRARPVGQKRGRRRENAELRRRHRHGDDAEKRHDDHR